MESFHDPLTWGASPNRQSLTQRRISCRCKAAMGVHFRLRSGHWQFCGVEESALSSFHGAACSLARTTAVCRRRAGRARRSAPAIAVQPKPSLLTAWIGVVLDPFLVERAPTNPPPSANERPRKAIRGRMHGLRLAAIRRAKFFSARLRRSRAEKALIGRLVAAIA